MRPPMHSTQPRLLPISKTRCDRDEPENSVTASLNRISPLLLTAVALATSGCQRQTEWYDFGNGLVNLGNTHLISSTASLSASAEPKMKLSPDASEEQYVRYQAHQQYCTDGFKGHDLEGSIPQLDQQAKGLFDAVGKAATPQYLATCRVEISGTASISFDTFTLRLNKYHAILDGGPGMKPDQTKALVAERLGAVAQGKSPWNDVYADVVEHVRPEFKLW